MTLAQEAPAARRNSLGHDSTVLAVASLTAQAATFLATVIVAREAGVSAFGLLAAGIGVATIIVDLTDFGTSTYLLRELAADRVAPRSVLSVAFRRVPLFILVACLALLALSALVEVPPALGALALYPAALGFNLMTSGACRARMLFRRAAVAVVLDRIILLAAVLATGVFELAAGTGFVVGLVLGTSCASLVCLWPLRTAPHRHGRVLPLSAVYRAGRHFGVATLAADLSTLEIPIVAAVAGPTSAGQFGAAQRVSGPLGIPASAVSAALFPRLAMRGGKQARRQTARALLFLIPLAISFLTVGLFAEPIVRHALGPGYGSQTVACLQIVLGAVWLGSLNQVLYNLLQSQGRQREVAWGLAPVIVAGLVMTSLGAWHFGPVGAACGVLTKEVMNSALLAGMSLRLDLAPAEVSLVPAD
jgi:O-antigen/teichoic acid export membrane protein